MRSRTAQILDMAAEAMEVRLILGQGIAGSSLAWWLHWAGHEVHLIDRQEEVSASKTAAGLITPFAGKRLVKAIDHDALFAEATAFYERVETTVRRKLLDRRPSLRLFQSDQERDLFLGEQAQQYASEIELHFGEDNKMQGFWMLQAARLRVKDFLNATRDYFAASGHYHVRNIDLNKDITVQPDGVQVHGVNVKGTGLIFCQGYQREDNPWFPGIPDAPARGEILQVRIPGRTETAVVQQRYWLAPIQPVHTEPDSPQEQPTTPGGEYVIGATYDRKNLLGPVDDTGRQELQTALRQMTSEDFTVLGHYSAVRAATKTRRPVVAVHEKYPQLAILNGMGSKASLLAPAAARALMTLWDREKEEAAVKRKPLSLIKLAHSIVKRAIQPGDTVIDATAGNGHDTLFLAQCVQEQGRVLSIDVQHSAIESTAEKLLANGVTHVTQIEGDHSIVLDRLNQETQTARVIMFNLGYLPGGDKERITTKDTTKKAVSSGLQLLSAGGVMTVTAYRGHPGGQEEANAVKEIARETSGETFSVDVIPGSENNHESPILYVFRRREKRTL